MADDLVVVLGAGPGLGRVVAEAFGRTGATVVLIARNRAHGQALADRVSSATGARVGFQAADATDEADLRSAFAAIREAYGDPTVLVHNPSLAYEAAATATPVAALLDGFALSAGSLLVAAQEVAPAMRRAGRGTILVTGSAAATSGSTWSAALGTQKAAVWNLTLSLAAELGPDGVRVAIITINGLLGTPGFEPDEIAAEYVRAAQDDGGASWRVERAWPPPTS